MTPSKAIAAPKPAADWPAIVNALITPLLGFLLDLLIVVDILISVTVLIDERKDAQVA
ncbi:MAG: hypothetical protein JWP63_5452 [Candidatus Solibacter sp.]|jgi:flagellar biosynthesis component FlhA|nr:hypothetical protein [Candidatus Solibacter sp.]